MAVVFIQEFKVESGDDSTRNYDAIVERLNVESNPPDGLVIHTAGFDRDAGVFRIVDVWESEAHGRRFLDEQLRPVIEAGDLPDQEAANQPPAREVFYEIHHRLDGAR